MEKILHKHHIIPKHAGGTDYESNLVHEFIFNEKKYIEITYTNSNDTECFLLFDYFGEKIALYF